MSTYHNYPPQTAQAKGPATRHVPYGQAQVPGTMEPYGAAPRSPQLPEHPQAMTVLVLGILSLVVMGVLGPVAWVLGNKAKRECDAGVYRMTDSLSVGRILGIIASVLLIVAGVSMIVMMVALLALSSSMY